MTPPPQQGAVPIADGTVSTNLLKVNADGSINTNPQAAVLASGTLQSAATANGNGTPLATAGDGTVVFTVDMAAFTGTVTFEGTEDGTNYQALTAVQLGANTETTNAVGSTSTSHVLYAAPVAGLQNVIAAVSGYSAGNVTVTAHALALAWSAFVTTANLVIGGTPSVAPADNITLAGTFPAVQLGQTGTGLVSVERVANVIKNVPGTAITAGTPASIWTPASGKKFRLLGYHLSSTVASSIIFKDGTTGGGAAEFLRTPIQAINNGTPSPPLGNGYLSLAANNQLWLDVTASGTVHGFAIGIEE